MLRPPVCKVIRLCTAEEWRCGQQMSRLAGAYFLALRKAGPACSFCVERSPSSGLEKVPLLPNMPVALQQSKDMFLATKGFSASQGIARVLISNSFIVEDCG